MERPRQLKRVWQYSAEFKVNAVKLSRLPGVQVQHAAQALDIHPFMLSRWRKEYRERRLRAKTKKIVLNPRVVAKLRQWAELQRRYTLLKQEHEPLKKAIRFCSQARHRSLPSSRLRLVSSRQASCAVATG